MRPPEYQGQPDLDSILRKACGNVIGKLLVAAKKLFGQLCLRNLMLKSHYVTQWKFLKRCSNGSLSRLRMSVLQCNGP